MCVANLMKGFFQDSIKSLIIGEWSFDSHQIKLADQLNYYDEIPDFARGQLEQMAGVKISNSLKIRFTSDNKFIVSNADEEIEYHLSVFPNRIWVSRSDYVLTLYYEFDKDGSLFLTSKPRVGESRVRFKRN